MKMEEINLLGFQAKDIVTGFSGTITSISFDLYGCIQALITPPINKEGKRVDSFWLDTNRLKVLSKKPVMKCRHTSAKNDVGGQSLPLQRDI